MKFLAGFFTLGLAVLAGCGSPVPAPAAATPVTISGNWEIAGTPASGSSVLPGPVAALSGSLASSGSIVTGTMRALSAGTLPCISISQDLAVTGTVSTGNLLTLKVPIAGGTATVIAQLGTTLQTFTAASYSIDSGPCAMVSTAATIAQLAPLTGTYTGTLTENLPTSGPTATATAVLTQSSTPTVDGMFPLSGTVTLTGACATTFSFTDGAVIGDNINVYYVPPYPLPPGILRGGVPTHRRHAPGKPLALHRSLPEHVLSGPVNPAVAHPASVA